MKKEKRFDSLNEKMYDQFNPEELEERLELAEAPAPEVQVGVVWRF